MKTSIRKFIKSSLVIIALSFICSCGESKSDGWSDENTEKFLSGCVKQNKGAVSDEKATEMCNCMVDKMKEQYTTMDEAKAMGTEKLKEMAMTCR